jgi:hypothetical protein
MPQPKPHTIRFELGRIVATPESIRALTAANETVHTVLARHLQGDWGVVDAVDAARNDFALEHELRVLSCYCLSDGVAVWVITEADRSTTTVLLPSEY